ncbi:MAG: exodeoxyribonuclease VII large subunit [Lachnospiraceae bacterium]|nr:exodeoxyribonuclease VII large subunit [Lachnospiraceae bacterium]
MADIYSVSQVNAYIKNLFLRDDRLNYISIRGEVSGCKYHTSGHIYFTLKDADGQLACVMFASMRKGLTFRLMDGVSVVVRGRISVYEQGGRYQLYANEILKDGKGDLFAEFERLKARLEQEGLFDAAHKKPIPAYPKAIGIVTALTGAAIQDMVNIAGRRNPYVQLILCPAGVQGEGAAETIVRGIRRLDAMGLDTIIVGRGGGSVEDLWVFNDERVARAIYECRTPIISAVGHETDFTIADFAADLRAPTPSAAAELAVNEVSLLEGALVDAHAVLFRAMSRRLRDCRNRMNGLSIQLKYLSPAYQLDQKKQRLSDVETRLSGLMKQRLLLKRKELLVLAERMKAKSPLDKLTSGYSYLADEKGRMINSVEKTAPGQKIYASVTDGEITAEVISVRTVNRQNR